MGILATIQGLTVATASWLVLAWRRRRSLRQEEVEQALGSRKEALGVLLDATVEIEEKQKGETDLGLLQQYLDEVTATKLRALRELRHEHLRGDRMFLVFLMQCSHLSQEIQAKLGNTRH